MIRTLNKWKVVVYSTIGVTILMTLIWALIQLGLNETVPIAAVVSILIGTFLLDGVFTRDDQGRKIENLRVVWMMRGALYLSAVSFATTLFGMVRFVAGSNFSVGEAVIGWFISIFFTLAVQLIMLFMSLELGGQMARMRTRPDDDFQDFEWNEVERRRKKRRQGFLLGVAVMVPGVVSAMVLFDWVSLADLIAFGTQIVDGEGSARYQAGIAVLVLSLVTPFVLGYFPWPRAFFALLVPLSIYFFSLMISWIFSFDSYYNILQSDEDESQRRGAIVRESAQNILNKAGLSLDRAQSNLLDSDEAGAFIQQTVKDLNSFVQQYREAGTALETQVIATRERNQRRISGIDDEISDLERRRQAELSQVMNVLGNRAQLESEQAQLESQLAGLQRDSNTQQAEIDIVNQLIAEKLRLAKCEEFGSDNPEDRCEGTSGISTCGTRCEGFKAEARNLSNIRLPAAEQALAQLRSKIAVLAQQAEALNIRIAATLDQTAVDENGENPLVVTQREIRDRYNRQVAKLRSEQDKLRVVENSRGDFSIDNVSAALARFRANPSAETADAYSTSCNTAKTDLIASGVGDAGVAAHDCQPPLLATLARRGDTIARASANFAENCVAEKIIGAPQVVDDAGESAGQNDIPVLRAIINKTRTCLAIANTGQDDLSALQTELTEVESVYLVSRADMRSSVADLSRGSFFAQGAALIALVGDLMILALSGYASAKIISPLLEDTLRPEIPILESKLRRAAAHHGPAFSEAVGMQTFLSFLEERQFNKNDPEETNFRSTLNRNAVPPEASDLVDDILRLVPSRYIRTVSFSSPDGNPDHADEQRVAIYQQLVEFMTDVAQSEQRQVRPRKVRREDRKFDLDAYAAALAKRDSPNPSTKMDGMPSPDNNENPPE